jgi:MFS transporter, DHA1 family, multidrug resistance protein
VITVSGWRAVFVFQCAAGMGLLLAMHRLLTESLRPEQSAGVGVAAVAHSYLSLIRDPILVGYFGSRGARQAEVDHALRDFYRSFARS